MADNYKFPDEADNVDQTKQTEAVDAPEVEVEIVDDTPAQDRGREPLPKELVKELDEDDLEEYSDKVKKRLGQMKKCGMTNAAPRNKHPENVKKLCGLHSFVRMKISS